MISMMFNLIKRITRGSPAKIPPIQTRNDIPYQLLLEEGLPHLFVESPDMKNPTHIVPTPHGDVVVQRRPSLNYLIAGNASGIDYDMVAGFYKGEFEPLSFARPSVTGQRLRVYHVEPIPAAQQPDIADALRSHERYFPCDLRLLHQWNEDDPVAGYPVETKFDLSAEDRIGVTECYTGIHITPEEFEQHANDQMDLAERELEAGRAEEAVRYLSQLERDAKRCSMDLIEFYLRATKYSLKPRDPRIYGMYVNQVKNGRYTELLDRSRGRLYSK